MAKRKRDNTSTAAVVDSEAVHHEFQSAELWRPTGDHTFLRRPEQILLENKQITPQQLEHAIKQQRKMPHLSILEALVQSQAIDEIQALEAAATSSDLPFMQITASEIDLRAFERLPSEYLKAERVIPIRYEDDAILVGISDPADIFLIDDLKHRLKAGIRLVVTPPSDILKVIDELSNNATQRIDEIIKDVAEDAVEVVSHDVEEVADLERVASESPVIRYVNYVIASAVKQSASDIHIEPGESRLRVRFRVDGVLFAQQAPPLNMHAAIISRLKIMANLDISERRLPQDGRIRVTVQSRCIDLRVSILPTTYGEKCAIRILDNRSILVGLENLGMSDDTLDTFRRQILQPHGIVLVTGPTGSGKSTTLYSALQIMDRERLNISTAEDPVEYELDFVNQVNVNENIGLTFAATLRSLLRQDPDIMMLGEVRDEETARIAVQASLTGHLVLSTLHTNDAPASITRLINIGIEPYLISASVNAALAQRLVRQICEHCKTPVTNTKENVLAYLKKYNAEIEQLYMGAGCEKCGQTGYKGRIGIYELFALDDELRDLISRRPTLGELRRAATAAGMRSLREDGLKKVAAGMTTVEEIMQVTET